MPTRGARRESDRLLEENKAMEWQLHKLRSQIEKDKARMSSQQGPIWKSSSGDKPLRSFAQEVRTKRSKKKEKKAAEPEKTQRVLRGSEAPTWSKGDVLAWLESIGLSQLRSAFKENEIDGEILLEIGVDDLDYMGIQALGIRKTILKEVAKLKRCCKKGIEAERPMTPGSSGLFARKQGQQWSEDEEKRREPQETFQPDRVVNVVRSFEDDVEVYDEEAERRAFQQAVEEWRNAGKQPEQKEARINHDGANPGRLQGGKLLDGSLNEEEEHAAFQSAVEEWRAGRGKVELVSGSNGPTGRETKKENKQHQYAAMLAQFEENLKVRHSPREIVHIGEEKANEQKKDDDDDIEFDVKGWDFDAAF